MEHVLELTEPEDFVQIQDKLFRRLAKSIASPHRQVAGRALFFWNNERFRSLVKHNIQTILPIMFASMYESSEYHWNRYGITSNYTPFLVTYSIQCCAKRNLRCYGFFYKNKPATL